jgi:CheY-like chemotaxis protein
VVVVTGSNDPETAERCESLGMFYGRKGPDFWNSVEGALVEIYPEMASKMGALGNAAIDTEVPQHSRVLVVDDDPDYETFLASRLNKYGVETLYAPDATHGFRIACKEKPTVIICDNYMPDGDAQHLLHRLRSTPATENIPVIVVSGKAFNELTEQTLRREICNHPGALRVFAKSFDTKELFDVLQKFCGFEKHH